MAPLGGKRWQECRQADYAGTAGTSEMKLRDAHSVPNYEGKRKEDKEKMVPCSCPFPWGHELPQSPAPPGYSYVSPSVPLPFCI